MPNCQNSKFQRTYHYVYLTYDFKNQGFYIGKHSCSKKECSYIGSGSYLNDLILREGAEHFKVIHREYFESSEKAFNYEGKLLTSKLLERKNCYNLQFGRIRKTKPAIILSGKELIKEKMKLYYLGKNKHIRREAYLFLKKEGIDYRPRNKDDLRFTSWLCGKMFWLMVESARKGRKEGINWCKNNNVDWDDIIIAGFVK